MPSKQNLFTKSPFAKGEDVVLAVRILYDYHKADKVRLLKSDEMERLLPKIRNDLKDLALPMADADIEAKKGVEDLPEAVDVFCRTTAGSVLEGVMRSACMKLWGHDLDALAVAAIVIYELPAGSTHIYTRSHQICYRYSSKDALAKVLRIVDTPPTSNVPLPDSPDSPLVSPVAGPSDPDMPSSRRRRRPSPPRDRRRPHSPSSIRERHGSPTRDRHRSPPPTHSPDRASSPVKRDPRRSPPPLDAYRRPNQREYIVLSENRDKLASRARRLEADAQNARKRERALKDEVETHKRTLGGSVELQAQLERELDMAVDIQAAGLKLQRAEENLQSVLQRLVTLAGGAEGKSDMLDALACVEARVRDLEAEVEIAAAARMAAEGKLQKESERYKNMLGAIQREYREPLVVPALMDAFAKVSGVGQT
ncbi:hypothetical protein OF83DRAFT_1150630 [Amylostereum chailletii]|nr:hypothetical protein OF83DRAFT_1150630 [Amylostereum chailletii]